MIIIKICFISFEYPPFYVGGAGLYAERLVTELKRLGHEIYVIAPTLNKCPKTSKEENVTRIPIIGRPGLKYLSFQLKLRKTVGALIKNVNGVDIIHSNTVSGFAVDKSSKIPRIITVHHSVEDIQQRLSHKMGLSQFVGEENPVLAYMERKSLHDSDKIIAVSDASKKFVLNHYKLPQDKVSVVHNGVNSSLFDFSPIDLDEIRKKYGVRNNEKLIFCTPARIADPRKGIKFLLQSLKKVFSSLEATCIITGSGNKEFFNSYLRYLPEKRVNFVGFLPENDKRKLFAACDVFVFPSLLEGCPLSILEAMAGGAPIVSTFAGGIPELVKTGINGLLVEPMNSNDLSEAILALLSDKEFSNKIRKKNYDDARVLYRWERTARMTEAIYRQVLGRS